MKEITREWLDEISDEEGLTKGQQHLLQIWCNQPPYVGQLIPDIVYHFIGTCKGYRGIPKELKDWLNGI